MRYADRSDGFEGFLVALNEAASTVPPPSVAKPAPTSTQIVGLPRSGTTLLYQLLAKTGEVGYPSNVMAFFHRTPWVGATLQEQLALTGPSLTFESVGGRTREPLDPHEFGYFWRRVCGHSSNSLVQDRPGASLADLRLELDRVATVFGRPVVYKNFLAIRHAPAMRSVDNLRFAVSHRGNLDVAASLLTLRERLGIAEGVPFGVQPSVSSRPAADVVELVARQVTDLGRDLRASGLLAPDSDTVVVDYLALCEDPRGTVLGVLEMMGARTGGVEKLPQRIEPAMSAAILQPYLRRRLEDALALADAEPEHEGD